MIAKSNLKKVSLKSVGAVVASGALVAAMAMPAFADSYTGNKTSAVAGDSVSQDVKVTYTENPGVEKVYSVDVAWNGMEGFAYTGSADAKWDPSTHTYDDATGGSWTPATGTVTVTNHSNAAVTAAASYQAGTNYTGITGTFTGSNEDGQQTSEELATGVGRTYDTADSETFTLTLSGDNDINTATVGTATVTITQAQ